MTDEISARSLRIGFMAMAEQVERLKTEVQRLEAELAKANKRPMTAAERQRKWRERRKQDLKG